MKLPSFASFLITPLNKLKYPQKFSLIGLLFVLPLTVTIYLLIVELNTRINNYGWREKYGIEYLRSVRELMEDVQKHGGLTHEYLLTKDNALKNELQTLQAQIDKDFETLALLDQQYGAILETNDRVNGLRANWSELETTAFEGDFKKSDELHLLVISNIRNLISFIGNSSNLTLDPELDSYYMTDTVLLKLPEAQELLVQLLILGNDVARYKVPTVQEKVQLIVLASLIKTNLEAMNDNVQTAIINNRAQNLKSRIEVPFQEDIIATGQLLNFIDAEIINTSTINVDPKEFEAISSRALQTSYNFYDAASPALENLIQARIDNLSKRRYLIIAFALGSTIVAFVIGLSMIYTISRPLSDLAEAAKSLGLGDLSTRVIVASADEMGQVGSAFNLMAEELQASQERVADRTRRLEIVATLSGHLNAFLRLEELLAEVVSQIKNSFGYYHAQIYLLDDSRENLVIAESAGMAGMEMKAKEHHIPLDTSTNLVAQAARTGQIETADNVREAAGWLRNPLLPDTYSEMAIPIILKELVVGVLNVQEDKIAGLDEGDANLLRYLANQIAVAIRNARLFQEVEAALAEAQATQERYLEQGWRKVKVTSLDSQYLYKETNTVIVNDDQHQIFAQARQEAFTTNRPRVVSFGDNGSERKTIVAPVRLRGKTIGGIQLHASIPNAWTEDDLQVIEIILEQLGQKAENLRLFEETRRRANREQTIRQITDKMRTTTSLEELIKTTATELADRLSAGHAVVELGIEPETDPQNVNIIPTEDLIGPI